MKSLTHLIIRLHALEDKIEYERDGSWVDDCTTLKDASEVLIALQKIVDSMNSFGRRNGEQTPMVDKEDK